MREIAALKNAVSGDVSKHRHRQERLFASSSFSTPDPKLSSESIKSFDDKFSTIIDDGAKSKDERSEKAKKILMTMQEINNASSQKHSASFVANKSIDDVSQVIWQAQQDESFN